MPTPLLYDLGPHAFFIIACYALSILTLIGLTLWVNYNEAHHKKMLEFFNEKNSFDHKTRPDPNPDSPNQTSKNSPI